MANIRMLANVVIPYFPTINGSWYLFTSEQRKGSACVICCCGPQGDKRHQVICSSKNTTVWWRNPSGWLTLSIQISKMIICGVCQTGADFRSPSPHWHHLSNLLCLFSDEEMLSEQTHGTDHNGWTHKRFRPLQCWENNHPITIYVHRWRKREREGERDKEREGKERERERMGGICRRTPANMRMGR